MQGPETDKADIASIREALQQGKNFCGRLLNYKKDRSAFWNLLTMTPIKDNAGKVLKYIGLVVLQRRESIQSPQTRFELTLPINLTLMRM